MKRKNIFRVAVFSIAVLFAYSAGAKIADFPAYRSRIGDLPLPLGIVQPLTWLVPSAEILVVGLLILPRLRVVGLLSAVCLLVIFSVYLLYLTQYPVLSCACGGVLEQIGAGWHLSLNTGFILLGIAGLRNKIKNQVQPINSL
jgi:putative oxidoreductase